MIEVILFSASKDVLAREKHRTVHGAVSRAVELHDEARAKGHSKLSVGFYVDGKLRLLETSRARLVTVKL